MIPPHDVSIDLGLRRLDRTWEVSRTYLASGTPAAWCLAYVPVSWHGQEVARPSVPGELRWQLEQELDVLVTHVVATIEAWPASGDCAEALKIPVATPLLLNRNLNLIADGKPIMVGLNYSDSRVLSARLVQFLSPDPGHVPGRGIDDRRPAAVEA